MAEFLTMEEAKSKFGSKGKTNAGLTLGIIGTALAAFAGNGGGCGCGILGNLFGGNNNCCAMQAADNLLATIRKSKEHIHAQLKAKEDKVNTLLELVESDPEIKKRLDEVMLTKNK